MIYEWQRLMFDAKVDGTSAAFRRILLELLKFESWKLGHNNPTKEACGLINVRFN